MSYPTDESRAGTAENESLSRIVTEHGTGHDFAIVDGRYLVDPWIKLVAGDLDRAVFDLQDPQDAALVEEYYGPRDRWSRLKEAEDQAAREYDKNGNVIDKAAADAQGHNATDGQKEAGNYEKGHEQIGPEGAKLELAIENAAGTQRRPEWPPLTSHYGYVKGTIGFDKDHLDMFVRPGTPLDWYGPVFVVNQATDRSDEGYGQFDEHKVMWGWQTAGSAFAAYRSNYTPGWSGWDPNTPIVQLSWPAFRKWAMDDSKNGPRGGKLTLARAEELEKEVKGEIPDAGGANRDDGAPASQRDLHPARPLPVSGAELYQPAVVELERQRTIKLPVSKIRNAVEAAFAFSQLNRWPRERFQAIAVDKRGTPIAFYDLFAGTLTQTSVYARELWTALYMTPDAAGVWFAHNHPSGTPQPSHADEVLTDNLKALLGPQHGVKYEGSLVIAGDRAWSMEQGMLDVSVPITPPETGWKSVPVMERVIRKQPLVGPSLTSPDKVRDFLRVYGKTEDGLVLLDAQHRVIGWMPMRTEHADHLNPASAALSTREIIQAVGRKNFAAAILYAPNATDITQADRAARTLKEIFGLLDVKLLDAFVPRAEGQLTSLAETGVLEPEARPYRAEMPMAAYAVYAGVKAAKDFAAKLRQELAERRARESSAERRAQESPAEALARHMAQPHVAMLELRGIHNPRLMELAAKLDRLKKEVAKSQHEAIAHPIDFLKPGGATAEEKASYKATWERHFATVKEWNAAAEEWNRLLAARGAPAHMQEFIRPDTDWVIPPNFSLVGEGPFTRTQQEVSALLDQLEAEEARVDQAYERGDANAEELDAHLADLKERVASIYAEAEELEEGHDREAEDFDYSTAEEGLASGYWRLVNGDPGAIENMRAVVEGLHYGQARKGKISDAEIRAAGKDALAARVARRSRIRAAYHIAPLSQGVGADRVRAALESNPLAIAMGPKLHFVEDAMGLPGHMLAELVRIGGVNRVRGAWDPTTGDTYLVGKNIPAGQEERTLVHEGVGHFGLEQVLSEEAGKQYTAALVDIYNARQGPISVASRTGFLAPYKLDLRNRMHQATAASEYIAHMAERGEEQTLWQAFVAKLRSILRSAGFVTSWTDNDLLRLLQLSRSALINGGSRTYNGMPLYHVSGPAPMWYSALAKTIESKGPGRAFPADWIRFIETQPGVKADEIEWSGIKDWLGLQIGRPRKEDVLGYLRVAGVKLDETLLGGVEVGDTEMRRLIRRRDDLVVGLDALGYDVEFGDDGLLDAVVNRNELHHQLFYARNAAGDVVNPEERPGLSVIEDLPDDVRSQSQPTLGETPRSMAALLREIAPTTAQFGNSDIRGNTRYSTWKLPGGENYRELLVTLPAVKADGWTQAAGQPLYRAPHFDAENIVVHVRFDERRDAEGKRVLFIEEIQSDWAEQGRKYGVFSPQDAAAASALDAKIAALKERGMTIDELEAYFRPGAIVQSYGGFDRVLRFNRGNANTWGSWSVDVREVEPIHETSSEARTKWVRGQLDYLNDPSRWRDVPRERQRNHSTDPSDDVVRELERERRALGAKVPPAPFIGKTEAWVGLALKRAIRFAVDRGFDRVAWTTGAQQNDRYSLAKQIDVLKVAKIDNGVFSLVGIKRESGGLYQGVPLQREVVSKSGIKADELDSYVGAELGAKIRQQTSAVQNYDTKEVGGFAMRTFYDRIVANVANDVIRKLGGDRVVSVQVATVDTAGLSPASIPSYTTPQPGFDITDKMRELGAQPMPMFSLGMGEPPATPDTSAALTYDNGGRPLLGNDVIKLTDPHLVGIRFSGGDAYQFRITMGTRTVGVVMLQFRGAPGAYGPVDQLLYIRTSDDFRGTGIGTEVVRMLLDYNGPLGLRASSVLPDARKFWENMGAEFVKLNEGEDGVIYPQNFLHSQAARATARASRPGPSAPSAPAGPGEGAARPGDAAGVASPEALEERIRRNGDEDDLGPQFSLNRDGTPGLSEVYGVRDGRVLGMATRIYEGGVWEVYIASSQGFERGQARRAQAASLNEVHRIFAAEGLEFRAIKPQNIPVPDRSIFDRDWVAPQADSWFRRSIIYLQNRLLLPELYERTIAKEVGPIPESAKAHREARLAHPRAAGKIADFDHDYTERVIAVMREHRLSLREVGEYLYARHAPERNAAIEQINPSNRSGSGMTDERAAQIIDRARATGKLAALERIGGVVDEINHFREEALLERGLSKREAVELMRAKYQHYVPLKEMVEEEFVQQEIGGGFQVGRLINTAFGRFTEAQAEYILPALIAQAKGTITAGENAEVLRSLLRLVSYAPNPDVWNVTKHVWKPYLDRDTGEVRYAPRPKILDQNYSSRMLSVPVNGERVTVELADQRLADAFKRSGLAVPGPIQAIGTITRFYALMATAANPEFVMTNLARDFQQAMIRITGEQNPALAAKVAKDMIPALWGAFSGLRAKGQLTEGAGAWHQWYRRYIEAGGHIAYRGMVDTETQHKDFMVQLAEAGIYPEAAGKVEAARLAAHRVAKRTGGKWFSDLVINLNGAVENALRLSAFKNAVEAGWTEKDAAMLSRNVTVDFNLKGEAGSFIGALYMFFNANIQGSAILFRSVANHPKVQIAAMTLFLLGMALSYWNRRHSEEGLDGRTAYDNISDAIKERNFVIMGPDGKNAILIPLPFGFNVFHVTGVQLMDVIDGPKKAGDAGRATFIAAVNAFNPAGQAPESWLGTLQLVSPTATDPMVQAITNRNFMDKPIKPERPRGATPQSQAATYFQGTPSIYVEVANWLNRSTGGNDVRSGLADISPNMIQHWVRSMFGSAGGFYSRVAEYVHAKSQGEEVEPRNIPFLRRFYYEPKDFELSHRFYENINKAEVAQWEVRKAEERGDREGARLLRDENQPDRKMYLEGQAVERRISELRKAAADIRRDDRLSDDQRKDRLQKIDEQARGAMMDFNRRFEEAQAR